MITKNKYVPKYSFCELTNFFSMLLLQYQNFKIILDREVGIRTLMLKINRFQSRTIVLEKYLPAVVLLLI